MGNGAAYHRRVFFSISDSFSIRVIFPFSIAVLTYSRNLSLVVYTPEQKAPLPVDSTIDSNAFFNHQKQAYFII